MFLRANVRKKNGKPHRYFSVVENRRLSDGRSTQRQILYLGEINDSQECAWRKTLEVFDARRERSETLALFPEDRPLPPDALNAVRVKMDQMRLRRARCFGNCWLGQIVWRQLGLDRFWDEELGTQRGEVPWAKVLELLVINRLIDPGAEFRLHRQWFDRSAMDELLVVARSDARVQKERAMRMRKLRKLYAGLRELLRQAPPRDRLLKKLGALTHEAGRAANLVEIAVPREGELVTPQTFYWQLRWAKFKAAARRDGHYILRTNLRGEDPAVLWQRYTQLTEVEAAFKNLKSDLALRPIHHQVERRVEAHIFVAFLGYCLVATLRQRLRVHAPGLTPRAVLEKLATIQMLDVWLPTTDGRWLVMPRYTEPDEEHELLLERLQLRLPAQPPPRIYAGQVHAAAGSE
jgi:hypothetical protein